MELLVFLESLGFLHGNGIQIKVYQTLMKSAAKLTVRVSFAALFNSFDIRHSMNPPVTLIK